MVDLALRFAIDDALAVPRFEGKSVDAARNRTAGKNLSLDVVFSIHTVKLVDVHFAEVGNGDTVAAAGGAIAANVEVIARIVFGLVLLAGQLRDTILVNKLVRAAAAATAARSGDISAAVQNDLDGGQEVGLLAVGVFLPPVRQR